MKRSTKAVLLSALVFPGAGHLFLRRKVPAVLLMLATSAALYVLMSSVFQQANLIAEKILSGEIQADVGTVADLLAVPHDGSNKLTLATVGLGIVWIVGVIDAWRVGRSEQPEPDERNK